jgi:hypothetical protein
MPDLCWLCFLDHDATVLDAASCCPKHGLVKDRVLGIVQVDTRMLDRAIPPAPQEEP